MATRRRNIGPQQHIRFGDARALIRPLKAASVDTIITSPPYWQKRDYGDPRQLGQESTSAEFVEHLLDVMDSWKRVLKTTGCAFVNLGDSMRDGCVVGVTTLFESRAIERGWCLAARIVWTHTNGMPDPASRLPSRYEFIFQLFPRGGVPFVDTFVYGQHFVLSQGNVWQIEPTPTKNAHLASFPEELPLRALALACPERVCARCGVPHTRQTERGLNLNPNRPQARRALVKWHESELTEEHLAAVRSTGINDAGKSLRFQNGAGRNTQEKMRLALEAKEVMGGYFRELTFALPEHTGWQECGCKDAGHEPGMALDPFAGTGTTLRAAVKLGRRAIGFDLKDWNSP